MKSILLTSGLLLALVACNRSPAEQQTQALDTTRSWVATARMTGEAWQQGSVPTAYAQQTLERTQEEIDKVKSDLAPAARSQLQLQRTLEQMQKAVEQNDRAAIATALRQLIAEQQQLDALAKSQGGQ